MKKSALRTPYGGSIINVSSISGIVGTANLSCYAASKGGLRGHEVAVYAPCASFHNLSLASLCWVTLTMLHRPYWLKSDIYVGVAAALIQFGFNIWRLVFVCLSLPMCEYWHEGFGRHIFSAVATACAIIFVQVSLVHSRQRDANVGSGPLIAARR
jgi:hypothetical protein